MATPKPYTDYAQTLKTTFPARVQKILVNAGFTCPNRDGSKGTGGCTYCNNRSFSPDYCEAKKSVTQQIKEGIAFFSHKYPTQQYLVYFQSYTNTYGDLTHLKSLYNEALAQPSVVGLAIGTRPDCINEKLLDYFAELAQEKYIMIEYGVESTHESTLSFINRQHTFAEAQNAIRATAERGIKVGAHLILGLPNETRKMILDTVCRMNELPIDALKLHQLQLIKGTIMANQYIENPDLFHFFDLDDYLELLIDFLEHLKPEIALERFVSQSPKELLIKPDWGLKNFEFTAKLEKKMRERNTFQGRLSHTDDTD